MYELLPHFLRICTLPKLGCSNITSFKQGTLLNRLQPYACLLLTQSRTTKIMKRIYPVRLHRANKKPDLSEKTHFVELEEDTDVRPDPLVDVVLTSYVKDVGNEGDIVSLKRMAAYHKLILPGLADYATAKNLEYARKLKENVADQATKIPPRIEACMKYLQTRVISIVMNKETEWTIEPWHIRSSFRKAGIHVLSDSCIELPVKPIKGPDMDLEGKEFLVTLTINKKYKVKVRCRIHHWSTAMTDRLPYVEGFWLTHGEKIFTESKVEGGSDTTL